MDIFEALKSREEVIKGKGVSESKINTAEKELGLKFANDYREYLANIGLVMCDGHEFTGIGSIERTNVVEVTKQMKSLHDDIRDDWYVIEDLNIDGAVVWQEQSGNIYINKNKAYKSLYEYILDL